MINENFFFSVTQDMGTMKPADPFRFSQATLEDTQEDELNAILGELSALQMSLDREISHQPGLLQVPGVETTKPSSSAPQSQSDNGKCILRPFLCLFIYLTSSRLPLSR